MVERLEGYVELIELEDEADEEEENDEDEDEDGDRRVIRLTDEGHELVYIFDSFGPLGRNGAGLPRYRDLVE